MDALGWQVGAILIGASTLIVGIYISKLLHSATKVVEKAYKIVDYNERYIHQSIEDIAAITKNTEEITDVISKITGIVRLFGFFKK